MIDYFWLFCGVFCGLGNAVWIRLRLRKFVASGEFAVNDVNSFVVSLALWILLPCVAFWLLQMSAGPEASPDMDGWPNPQRGLAVALQLFIWFALVYWTCFMDGATTLSKYLRMNWFFEHAAVPPVVFKVLAIAVVISGLLSLLSART